MKKIVLDSHALHRVFQRAISIGLAESDIEWRIKEAIISGYSPKKHRSKRYKVKCRYFLDNISVYVIFRETNAVFIIKTIILEKGRE